MLEELSRVVLVRPWEEDGTYLGPGARGTIMNICADGKAYIVEFNYPLHAVGIVEADMIEAFKEP